MWERTNFSKSSSDSPNMTLTILRKFEKSWLIWGFQAFGTRQGVRNTSVVHTEVQLQGFCPLFWTIMADSQMQHTITLPGTGPQTHNESSSNTWEVCGVLWTLSLPVTDSWLLFDYVTVCSTSSPSPSVLPRRGNTLITYLKIWVSLQ